MTSLSWFGFNILAGGMGVLVHSGAFAYQITYGTKAQPPSALRPFDKAHDLRQERPTGRVVMPFMVIAI